MATAEEGLPAADALANARMNAHACFCAQQSGEKAIKSLWFCVDADPWGRSIQRLVSEFPRQAEIPEREVWIEQAALLDKFYIPTRYPNGLPDLTPGQVYRLEDAQRGIAAAQGLLRSCKKWLAAH